MTVPEAARRARRNPETIRRWIREGKLASSKVGTQYLIDEEALAEATRGVFAHPVEPALGRRLSELAVPYATSQLVSLPAAPFVGDFVLPQIVGRIVRAVDPVRIVLFGSRARGVADDASDFDLLVVLDELQDRRETRLEIRRVLDDLPIAKDVIVATNAEVSGDIGRPRGVLHWALAEGRVLYERD